MAACNTERNNEHSTFQTHKPRFIKIILDHIMKDEKLVLGIPKKFANKYGNDLPNPVILKVPTGAVWEVELVKSRNRMWFQKGWKEFADFYTIADGYFLVFEYKKGCHFHVLIFNGTACEIDYPLRHGDKLSNMKPQRSRNEEAEDDVSIENLEDLSPSHNSKGPLQSLRPIKKTNSISTSKFTVSNEKSKRSRNEEIKDDVSVEILEDPSPSHKRKCPSQYLQPMKKMNSSSTGKFAVSSKELFPPTGYQSCARVKDNVIPMSLPGQQKSSSRILRRRTKPLTNDEKVNALSRASSAFKSNNPFFMVAMQPAYLHPGYKVAVTASFFRKHLKRSESTLLYSVDEKTWLVHCRRYISGCHERMFFVQGWKEFVEANQLEVADVCVFELIDKTKKSLKVTIFRGSQMISG